MSVCRMDYSPWCTPGTCADCDAARATAGEPRPSSWTASAVLIAQLRTAITERDTERDPFAHRSLCLRVVDLQYRLAELNSAETVRVEARESPLADAWLEQIGAQAETAIGIAARTAHPGAWLTDEQVRQQTSARVSCVLAVPALLAEIRRLREEQERNERLLRAAIDELAFLRAKIAGDL